MQKLQLAENLPPPSKDDFFFEGERADLLFIHGFSSSPYELLPLAKVLRQLDVRCRSLTLSGHCSHVSKLNQVKADDWKADLEAAFLELDENRPRFLVAASMGAALSILHAATHPKDSISGLILCAPALIMHPKARIGVTLATKGIGRFVKIIDKGRSGGDLAHPEGQEKNPSYKKLPVLGVREFESIRMQAYAAVKQLKVPFIVFHGIKDNTISVEASRYLIANAQAESCGFHLLPRSQHVIGLDYDRHTIEKHSASFIEQRIREYYDNAKRRVF